MKGNCPECIKMQQQKGLEDYCCLKCVLMKSGLGDYMSKNEDGTIVVDLAQKIIDTGRQDETDKTFDS